MRLGLLKKDEDEEVRRIVAPACCLTMRPRCWQDDDWVVRLEAVQRAPLEAIAELVDDVEPDVRAAVRQRLSEFLLGDDK